MDESPLAAAHRRVLERRIAERTAMGQAPARPGFVVPEGGSEDGPDRIPWGVGEEATEPSCWLVASYGELEIEYAAIRRATAVMDRADRGLVSLNGSDAAELLGNLLSNAIPEPGECVRGFLLARTGRILADVLAHVREDGVDIDLDRTDAAAVASHLESFVFAEDVQIVDRTAERTRIELHGPDVEVTLQTAYPELPDWLNHWSLEIDGTGPLGVPGLAIDVPNEQAEEVWETILAATPPARRPPRPIGWHALNVARIEAGSPFFHIDFGGDALPHETGVLSQRVSFRKGCYPGQEVVARMESRGKSKRSLVGLRIQGDLLPVAGAQVFKPDPEVEDSMGEQVGIITSSSLAPMLGAVPVAFASVRSASAAPGTRLRVVAEGEPADAIVGALDFLADEQATEPTQ